MGRLTIGSFSSPAGTMSLDFAIKLAEAAINKGHAVDLWLSGNATVLGNKDQKHYKDYSHLQKTVKLMFNSGRFRMAICEACAETRGCHKDITMDECIRASMDWHLASCFSADRVIMIGDN
ncbi:MAG: DsrE family protein [Nitrospirae bacterium]|nr:DsrE family protein [Nitrospirota bacterium]